MKTELNSDFTNDLKRNFFFFSKNVQSYRLCSFKIQAFGRIPNYIVHKYKSYLRGLEVFFSLDPSTKRSNSYPRAPLTPSRVLPVCDNCHNASTIFKDSNKTLGPRLEKLCRRSLKTTKAQTSLCIRADYLAPLLLYHQSLT